MATSESGAFSRLPDIMSLIGIMLTGAKRLARRVGAKTSPVTLVHCLPWQQAENAQLANLSRGYAPVARMNQLL